MKIKVQLVDAHWNSETGVYDRQTRGAMYLDLGTIAAIEVGRYSVGGVDALTIHTNGGAMFMSTVADLPLILEKWGYKEEGAECDPQ